MVAPKETIRIALNQGGDCQHFATIDAEDYERQLVCQFQDEYIWFGRICDLSWKALVKQHTNYAINIICNGTRELRLHRVVMCAKMTQIIDHVDGNGLNCCKFNLRHTDEAGNAFNRRKQKGQSSSQFKGVSFHSQTGKFEAYIKKDRKKFNLGLFAEEKAAARAYDAKALELFGEYAALNFPVALVGK